MEGGLVSFFDYFEPGRWYRLIICKVEICERVMVDCSRVVACPSQGRHRMCRLFRSCCSSHGVNCSGVSSSHVGGGRSAHGWFGTDGQGSGSGHGSVHGSGGGGGGA